MTPFADAVAQSLQATRRLARERRFLIAFVATLALGLAANMAVFSVLDAYLLRPLPYPASPRLVDIFTSARAFHMRAISSRAYHELSQLKVFSASGLIRSGRTARVRLRPGSPPRLFPAGYVTASLFPTLGIPPLIGRWPALASGKADGPREAVLSKTLWQNAFRGNPDVLGKTLIIHDQSFVIVGVMPQTFSFPTRRTQLWISTLLRNENQKNPFSDVDSMMIARLAPGVTPGVLHDALNSGFRRLVQKAPPALQAFVQHAHAYAGFSTLRRWLVGSTGKRLLIIQLGAGLLLLLAFSSLTNLALVRQLGHFHEQALRSALGARFRDAFPTLLGEAVLLASLSTLIAWPLAHLGEQAFVSFGIGSGHTAFKAGSPAWSWWVLWLLAFLTSFLILGLPRLLFLRKNLRSLWAGGSRVLESVGIDRLRVGLSIVQIGLAVLLLITTFLVGRTLTGMLDKNPGFKTHHLVVAQILLSHSDHTHWSHFQVVESELAGVLKRLPDHPGYGIAGSLPFLGDNVSVFVRGTDFRSAVRKVFASNVVVGPGTLRLLGVHLLSGRLIGEPDIMENAPVVVVDRRFAKGLFGTTHVLGKIISGLNTGLRIVGVVGSIHDRFVRAYRTQGGTVFFPDEKGVFPVGTDPLDVLLHSNPPPSLLHRELETAFHHELPNLVLARFSTYRSLIHHSLEGTSALATLIGAFGLLALTLATIGTFGVIAYLVGLKERELALREALGATPDNITLRVLRLGIWLWAAASALGIATAWWALQLLTARVYGLKTSQPAGYVLPTLAVGLAVLSACAIPALRLRRASLLQILRS